MASTVLRFVGLWVWLRGSGASVGHVLPHIDVLGAAALFASAALLVSTAALVTSASGFTRLASPSGEDRLAPVNGGISNSGTPGAQVYRFRDCSIEQVDAMTADRPIGTHDTYVFGSDLFEAYTAQCGGRS